MVGMEDRTESEKPVASSRISALKSLYGPGSKLYRDVIWTEISLSKLAVDIIDTPEFQRLDSIKQLGFTDYIYRGAKHSRFLHSIGTYHVTKRIITAVWHNHARFGIEPPMDDKLRFEEIGEIAAIAALLHDLSHVPYGHTLEDEHKDLYVKHDDLLSTRLWHYLFDEASSIARLFENEIDYFGFISNQKLKDLLFLIITYKCKITLQNGEVGSPEVRDFEELIDESFEKMADNPLEVEEYDSLKEKLEKLRLIYSELTEEGLFEPYLTDMVSNTICADLIDYISRDTHGTGLKYEYDPRIERYFTIQTDNVTGKRHLVLKLVTEKGLKLDITSTMIDLMNWRYSLGERVYYHKTKVSADVMLGKLLSVVGPPKDVNPYSDVGRNTYHWEDMKRSLLVMGDEDIFEYCRKRVSELTTEGKEEESRVSEELLFMLENRRLFKPVVIIPHASARSSLVNVKEDGSKTDTRTLYKVLYDMFRKGREAAHRVESEINDLFNDGSTHVMIFCPEHKPQAKEMETVVEILPGQKKRLNLWVADESSALPEPLRQRIVNLNNMYSELWKFFVLIHPDDYENEVVRSAIALMFWLSMQSLGVEVGNKTIADSVYPPPTFPQETVDVWAKGSASWSDERIIDLLEKMAQRWPEWVERAIVLRETVSDMATLCDMLYEHILKQHYADMEDSTIVDKDPGEIVKLLKEKGKGIELARVAMGDNRKRLPPHLGVLMQHKLLVKKRDSVNV